MTPLADRWGGDGDRGQRPSLSLIYFLITFRVDAPPRLKNPGSVTGVGVELRAVQM